MNSAIRTALFAAAGIAAAVVTGWGVRRLFSGPATSQAVVTIGVPPNEMAELLGTGELAAMAAAIAPGALNIDTVTVRAAPHDRGSELHVTAYHIGQKPLKQALHACKARIETGEVPTGARSK